MSLAVAYGMKKRMAKGGMAHKADCPGCEMCMAEGGDVKDHPHADKKFGEGYKDTETKRGDLKGVHAARYNEKGGRSAAGSDYAQSKNYYPKDGEKGYHREHSPEQHLADARRKHSEVLSELKKMPRPRGEFAEGGFVEEEESSGYQPEPMENPEHMAKHDIENQDHDMEALDMVSHIMQMRDMAKGYSEGGAVSNDAGEGQEADKLPNQFDDLVLDSDQMDGAEYTGENSGDEIGDEQKDEDERDVVSSIMKSRKKKDRLPNPR